MCHRVSLHHLIRHMILNATKGQSETVEDIPLE